MTKSGFFKRQTPSEQQARRNKAVRVDQHEGLRKMLFSPTDVIFVVSGQRFAAHRVWVSAASPVLEKALKHKKEKEVTLAKCNWKLFRWTLDFIYDKGFALCTFQDGEELIKFAKTYQVKNLEKAVYDSFVSLVDEKNRCKLLVEAKRRGLRELKDRAMEVLAYNFMFMMKTDTLSSLDLELIDEVLQNKNLKVRSELDVLFVLIR